MSRLDDLIKLMCPDEVSNVELGQFAIISGTGVDKKINANEKYVKLLNYMDVYRNRLITDDIIKMEVTATEKKIVQCDLRKGDVFITPTSETIDDIGHASVIVKDIPNAVYSYHLMRIRLTTSEVSPFFIRYLFQSDVIQKQILLQATGLTRYGLSKGKFEKLQFPLPPLPVQEEIVRILDKLTSMETELEMQLEMEIVKRKKQYEFYKSDIFTFSRTTTTLKLGEIAEIGTGKSNANEELEVGKYPFFVRSQEIRLKNTFEFDETAIITSGDGVGVGKIFHYVEGKYALHQRAYRIHITDTRIIPKYYFYYMKTTFYNYIQLNAVNSSVTSIRRPMLYDFPVPIPTRVEQEHIIDILDRFEILVNDMSQGLQAEILARKQQHEYLSNKLLTFKEKTL
jgi:type I restriction enzyme S subunit